MSSSNTRDARLLTALARRLDTDDPVALTNFAWLAARGGQGATGLAAARRAVTIEGAPRAAWLALERLAVGRSDGLLLVSAASPSHTQPSNTEASRLVAAVRAHSKAVHGVAEACYQAAVADPRTAAAAWNGLAVLHEQRDELDAADEAWRRSLETPTVAATHNRALAWSRRGETGFAETVLDRSSSLVSDSAPLLFLRGYLALLAGDLYSAQDSMEAARSRNQSLPRVEFTLGLIYEHTGQHALALDSTRRALLMSPLYLPQVWLLDHGLGGSLVELAASGGTEEHAAYTDTVLLSLGRSLLDAGHLGESLAVFDQVLLRDEDHTGALFHRGVVLAKLRRYDEAMEDWAAVQHGGEESPVAVESARHSRSALRLAALFSGS